MRILVSIGDTHYTDVSASVVANNEEAVTKMQEGMDETYELSTEDMNGNARITLTDNTDPDDVRFVIGQTFEVPDGLPYVVVRHHAYDGVGFSIVGSAKTSEWAMSIMRTAVETYINEEFDDENGTIDYVTPEQSCFDTSTEWDVFTIVSFEEVA